MKILFSILLVGVLTGSKSGGARPDWIDSLKRTPVSHIEAGLPDKPFDRWLQDLTQSAPRYQLTGCETAGSASAECITVTAEAAHLRLVELIFAPPSQDNATAGAAVFLRGTVGPSDPRSKQPTRLVRKLSELLALLH